MHALLFVAFRIRTPGTVSIGLAPLLQFLACSSWLQTAVAILAAASVGSASGLLNSRSSSMSGFISTYPCYTQKALGIANPSWELLVGFIDHCSLCNSSVLAETLLRSQEGLSS